MVLKSSIFFLGWMSLLSLAPFLVCEIP